MSLLNRRESLRILVGGLLGTAGTVVLASAVLPARAAQGEESAKDIEQRADRLAEAHAPPADDGNPQTVSFLNGGFRKGGFVNGGGGGGGGGAFRNGGFANGGGGGAFKNGGFANGGGGGGGFANGGWRNA
jgi:hypothetical protein